MQGSAAQSGWEWEGKQEKKEARPASKTSTRNSSSLLCLTSSPFAGSRPSRLAEKEVEQRCYFQTRKLRQRKVRTSQNTGLWLQPVLQLPSWCLPSLHSSHAGLHSRIQTGIKHFAPQGLCTGCYFSLEPFLPMPLSCPFLVIPLLEVC